MFLRRKSSKRNPKPFRRHELNGGSGLSTFEWLVFICLIVCNFVVIYGIIRTLMI